MFSSSSANACLVESEKDSILIDAGQSYKRLLQANPDVIKIHGSIISHEHVDHVKGAGVLGRKIKKPIYIPEPSFEKRASMMSGCDIHFINGGDWLTFGNLKVNTFSTRHDCSYSIGMTVSDGISKFGYVTDTGSFSKSMKVALQGCDAYLIEADYDEKLMEEYDGYDDILKDRIRSPWGHLSNDQTLTFIKENIDLTKVKWILLGHISKNSNSEEVLMNKVKEYFPKYKDKFQCAPSDKPLII